MDEPSVTVGAFDSYEMCTLLEALWEVEKLLRLGHIDGKAGALAIRQALHNYERVQMGLMHQDPSIHRGNPGITFDPKCRIVSTIKDVGVVQCQAEGCTKYATDYIVQRLSMLTEKNICMCHEHAVEYVNLHNA